MVKRMSQFSLLYRRPIMMKIADVLSPYPGPMWTMAKQCGVTHAVGTFDSRLKGSKEDPDGYPWSYMSLVRMKSAYENGGFELSVIESRPPTTKIKLGLPGRDEEIETIINFIKDMGRLKIPVWCYEWMPVMNWMRTSVNIPTRGGALVTGYDHDLMQNAPLTEYGEVSEETLWENLESFLKIIVPVAEEAGVKLAMHPDDPPLSPIRGMGRIMRSIDNYRRLLNLVPSPVNGIALCQGNFTLMTDDLPAVIREFAEKIFFVHFRDVQGTAKKFQETFHDIGKTDMAACLRAYRDTGYEGVGRVDHVPTMVGEENDRPGYTSMGRLFALGYFTGLREAIYSEEK
jgi:mannonate dehydratase